MICVSLSMLFPLCLNISNSAAFHHASAFRLPYHRVYVWISIGLCVYVSCVYFGPTMSIYIYGNCNSCLFCIYFAGECFVASIYFKAYLILLLLLCRERERERWMEIFFDVFVYICHV